MRIEGLQELRQGGVKQVQLELQDPAGQGQLQEEAGTKTLAEQCEGCAQWLPWCLGLWST